VTPRKSITRIIADGARTSRCGWVPDVPDQRDLLSSARRPALESLPLHVDLRMAYSVVEDQGTLGSSTGNVNRTVERGFSYMSETKNVSGIIMEEISRVFLRDIFWGDTFAGSHRLRPDKQD
jgi:hypothetical protein